MSDQKLEPCPFCGSKAEIITLQGETDEPSIGAQCVQCTSSACGAASGLIYPLMDNVTDLLIERWNTRALTQPPAQPAVAPLSPTQPSLPNHFNPLAHEQTK